MMKGEIRGLFAGTYFSDEDDVLLKVTKVDGGVSVELVDIAGDIFYSFLLDNKETKYMEIGSAFPSFEDEEIDY